MAAALVSVSTGVMKPLLSKLAKLLEEEFIKLKGVRKDIKFLKDELSVMAPTLEMLADAEQLDPQTREWRDKLRELAYDLEDCIDDFMVRVEHERDGHSGFFKRFFNKLKKLKPRHEIANQIEQLKACVIETSERHKRYQLMQISSTSRSTCEVDPRLPALYVEIDKLVGIDGPMKHIMEWLTMKTEASAAEPQVLSIVGCGGLGKTTLANQVYQNAKSQFSCSAFVSVSRTPDAKKILRDIAKEVGITADNILDDDVRQLIDKLRRHLLDKRYLIVVDDIWDKKPWETIKNVLVNKDCDSRVITTTRSTVVASSVSSHGDEILRRCGGLPLAIITISSILTDQHGKGEWDRVLNDIGTTLAKNLGSENMTTILSMSYFDIPHNLRTCLLYLSVFPEDYVIKKQRLINRWIAEGFIHEEDGRTKYEIAEGYFNDLINRSMIQPIDVKYGQAKACRVHDIILDYIKCKAAEENFVTSLDAADHAYPSEYKVRRLCVSNHIEENVTIWTKQIMFHVRSVTIFGDPVKTSLLPSSALRVLDLGDCWAMDDHHLSSIEKWFHLKYLRLSSVSITKLPEEVGGLYYLQTLDIQGTGIEEVPSSITKLRQLVCLYVDCDARFPAGTIGLMLSLEELRDYGVKSYEQMKSLQEFSKLTKLRTLKITWDFDDNLSDGLEGRSQAKDIDSYVGNILSSCNLHCLSINNFHEKYPMLPDSYHPAASCSIHKLCWNQFIYKVPNWMGSLGNLSVLKMRIILVRPEDVEILGEIPSLLFLKLHTSGGTNGKIVIHGNNTFRSLKYFCLCITNCGTSLEFEFGSMPKLEHMKLKFCVHKMKCLNGDASSLGIQHLSALTKVEVTISGNHTDDRNYNPAEDNNDDTVTFVSRAIKAATETLPNRSTVRFEIQEMEDCCLGLKKMPLPPTEWLNCWQIRRSRQSKLLMGRLNKRY
ncbi:hypothetical protein U9M48_040679 [Paspalum notatum var. saurae]|uniref:Uncharacterized protein n=1 Tax=Paspalum notatum var. saurae TaxID=547442 RepID=A0AAQ3USV5_PASNO